MIEALIGVRFDTFDTSPGIMGTETANNGSFTGTYGDIHRRPKMKSRRDSKY